MTQHFKKAFAVFSQFCIGTILFFVLINGVVFFLADKEPVPFSHRYNSKLLKVYPRLGEAEIKQLLRETWSKNITYDPFTEFRDAPRSGVFVNVDEIGFRKTVPQGPWPPSRDNINVFLYGGSTSFGYGVEDKATIASHLQTRLSNRLKKSVCVYNFGRAYYYSSQERILFERHLLAGFVPDVAIFIDGMNDSFYVANETGVSSIFKDFVSGFWLKPTRLAVILLQRLPISRLVYSMKKDDPTEPNDGRSEASFNDLEIVNHMIDRYEKNAKMIELLSRGFGVSPLFVWQPVPNYHYDTSYHLFFPQHPQSFRYAKYVYSEMARRRKSTAARRNFLWLGDIQRERREPLYVDYNHYSGSFSEVIADHIAERIEARGAI